MPNVLIKIHKGYGIPNKLKEPIVFVFWCYFALDKKIIIYLNILKQIIPVIIGKIFY